MLEMNDRSGREGRISSSGVVEARALVVWIERRCDGKLRRATASYSAGLKPKLI